MNSPLLIRVLIIALGIAAVSLCTGCATIVKGTTQAIPVASEPTGARGRDLILAHMRRVLGLPPLAPA